MKTILVADVFGRTTALITLANKLGADVIIDPYNGIEMNFKNEVEAYAYFINHVGLDVYLDKLLKIVSLVKSDIVFIGFSVGASIIWRLSELVSKQSAKKIKRAICFYGSQIRNFTNIHPLYEIELIFPKAESHFDVIALQNTLANLYKVDIIKTDYLHGFMNEHSENFNKVGFLEHVNKVKAKIHKGSI